MSRLASGCRAGSRRRTGGRRRARRAGAEERRHAPDQQHQGSRLRRSSTRLLDPLLDERVCDLREALQLPGQACSTGCDVIPEVATGFPKVSPDGKTQTINLKRTYRFNTGAHVTAANYLAAFNRDANPKLQSPGVTYLHEITGADAVINGKAPTISGVTALDPYTLQVTTTAAARPGSADHALFLSDSRQHAAEPDRPPGRLGPLLHRLSRPGSADRARGAQPVLSWAAARAPRPDRLVDRVGQAACQQAVEQDEQDSCAQIQQADVQELATRYGINKPNGRFFVNPRSSRPNYFVFNNDRTAFKGTGNRSSRRSTGPSTSQLRSRLRLSRRQANGSDPACGDVRRTRASTPARATDQSLSRARASSRKRSSSPRTPVLYASNCPCAPWTVQAQIFQYDMKRLGIDVQIEYFGFDTYFDRIATRGEPFDVAFGTWATDYADGAGFDRCSRRPAARIRATSIGRSTTARSSASTA